MSRTPCPCGRAFFWTRVRQYLRLAAADELENDLATVGPAPVRHEIDALPSSKRELASGNRHLQRHTIEHGLDVGRHVIGPFDIVNPWRVLGREPVERGNQIGLERGLGGLPG